MNLKFKSVFIPLLVGILAMLMSGCQTVANVVLPSARAAYNSPDYRPSARVDFRNTIEGATMFVIDDVNQSKSGPIAFGKTGWVPLRVGFPYANSPYYAGVSATIEIHHPNGKVEFKVYRDSFDIGQGRRYHSVVVGPHGFVNSGW